MSEDQDQLYEAPPPNRSAHRKDIWRGIGLTALLHLLLIFYPVAVVAIGIVQLLYVIPALIYFRKRTGMMQGILLGAGITFLLNAACFGLVLASFS